MKHGGRQFFLVSVTALGIAGIAAAPLAAAQQMQYASGWSVKTGPNWTPPPPSTNPLGAPEGFGSSLCVGGINPTPGNPEYAEFTFTGFAGVTDPITGIEVRVKYISAGLDVRLTKSGGLVGNTKSLPFFVPDQSNCDNTAFNSAGGPGDVWGAGLTAADFNANSVGFRLTLTGNTADIDAVELVVFFGNNPPSAEANGPYAVDEGGSVTLSSAGSSDPDGDTLTFAWDLDNNGSFETSGASPSFSAVGRDGPDTQTVVLKVTDTGALSDTDTATVNIANVAPTVAVPSVAPEPSDEGSPATASATFTDPAGTADAPYTCTVDYGDGSGPVTGTVTGTTCTGPAHTYGDDGIYTIIVTVTDDDGGTGSKSGTHVVDNVPPSVGTVSVSPEPSDEGEAVSAEADFTDPGADDSPFTCTVDYGDGAGAETGTVSGTTCTGPSHTYADDGAYVVEVCVTDKDGGTGCNSATHQVDNVDPTITATTNSAEDCGDTPEGGVVEISADFSDPGFDSSVAGTLEDFDASEINWGDGTVEPATVTEVPGGPGVLTTGTASGSHTYTDGGIYTITVTIIDDDGGSAQVGLIALVTGAGLNGGEVQVVGTDFKDVVNIQSKGTDLEVMAGFLGVPGKRRFPLVDVVSLRVLTCDEDDQIHVNRDTVVPATLDGGAGFDHIRAGSGLSLLIGGPDGDHLYGGDSGDVLEGGPGPDFLWGGPGGDILMGDEDDDTLFGQAGDDLLDGGPGLDKCRGGTGSDILVSCEDTVAPNRLGRPEVEGGA